MNGTQPQAAIAVREAQTSIQAYDPTDGALSTASLLGQVKLIQEVMGATMQDGQHYGKIPGCGDKPTLLKPGAEKLCLTFRLAPRYNVVEREFPGGHREYRVTCGLSSILTKAFVGEGVGTCSTLEAKYRYRGKAGRRCPMCDAIAIIKGKEEYGGGWLCYTKKNGCGQKFRDGDKSIEGQSEERQENPDIADTWNTCLKMAKKRALVDAVLTATAASDIFTQDIEDLNRRLETEDAEETVLAPREERRRPARSVARAEIPEDLGEFNAPQDVPYPQGQGESVPVAEVVIPTNWRDTLVKGKRLGDGLGDNPLRKLQTMAAYFVEHPPADKASKRIAAAVALGVAELERADLRDKDISFDEPAETEAVEVVGEEVAPC